MARGACDGGGGAWHQERARQDARDMGKRGEMMAGCCHSEQHWANGEHEEDGGAPIMRDVMSVVEQRATGGGRWRTAGWRRASRREHGLEQQQQRLPSQLLGSSPFVIHMFVYAVAFIPSCTFVMSPSSVCR